MYNNVCFTYLRLRNPSQDVLFSGPEDYRATIEVIAELSKSHTPIGVFCLLEQEVHLIAIADEAQGLALSRALMQALTGDSEHPLGRHWSCSAIEASQLPELVAKIHLLPCQQDLCSKAEIHRWSSHQAFAHPALTPTWLATEAIWRKITPRYSNRVRAYLHKLEQPVGHPLRPKAASRSKALTPRQKAALPDYGEGLTARKVAEFVLNDHQTQWAHLTHHRSSRRKLYLAGLSCALCQYLNIYDQNSTLLGELFDCPAEELAGLARLASREASQYIITSASKLSAPSMPDNHVHEDRFERAATTDAVDSAAENSVAASTEKLSALDDYDIGLSASADDIDLQLDFTAEGDIDLPSIRLVAGR